MDKANKKELKEVIIEALEPFATAIQTDIRNLDEKLTSKIDNFESRVDARFIQVEDDIRYIKSELRDIHEELKDIKKKLENVIYRHEFEALRERITRLEAQVSSGRS